MKYPVLVWNVAEQEQVHQFIHDGLQVGSVDFSDTQLATVNKGGSIIVHKIPSETATEWTELRREQSRGGLAVEFSPSGKKLAIAFYDGKIALRDSASWEQITELQGAPTNINDLTFSDDGRRIIAGGADNDIRTWDVESGRVVFKLPVDDVVTCLAATPDGRWLAAADESGCRLWSTTPPKWRTPARAAAVLDGDLKKAVNANHRRAIVNAVTLHPETLDALIELRPDDLTLKFAKVESLRLRGRNAEAAEVLADAEVDMKAISEDEAHAWANAIQTRVFDESRWKTLNDFELEMHGNRNSPGSGPRASNGNPKRERGTEDPAVSVPRLRVGLPSRTASSDQHLGVRVGGGQEEFTFYAECPVDQIQGLRVEVLPEVGAANQTESFDLRELEAYIDTVDGTDPQPVPLTFHKHAGMLAVGPQKIIDGEADTDWNFGIAADGAQWAVFSCPDAIDASEGQLKFVIKVGVNHGFRRLRLSVSDQPVRTLPISVAWSNEEPASPGFVRLATAFYLAGEFKKAEEALAIAKSDTESSPKYDHMALILESMIQRAQGHDEESRALFGRATTAIPRWTCQAFELELMKLAYADFDGVEEDVATTTIMEFWRNGRRVFLEEPSDDGLTPKTLVVRVDHYLNSNRWYDAALEYERIARTNKKPQFVQWMRTATLYAKAVREGQCNINEYNRFCNLMIDRYKDPASPGDVCRARLCCLLLGESGNAIKIDKLPTEMDIGSAPSWYAQWDKLTRSLAAYRHGDFRDAVKLAADRINESTGYPIIVALANAVKGIALARNDQNLDEANAALANAREFMHNNNVTYHEDGSLDGSSLVAAPLGLRYYLMLDSLIREAEELLAEK